MSRMNRLATCINPYQGPYKRVLCVCSAGLLRSPTAAVVLSQEPYNYNTRAAGLGEDFALVYAGDEVLLTWADEIVCMMPDQRHILQKFLDLYKMSEKPIICLNISDNYEYRDKELIGHIKTAYKKLQPINIIVGENVKS